MKLDSLYKTIKTYQNPLEYYWIYFGLSKKKKTTLRMRNGLSVEVRPEKGDHYNLTDIFVTGEYDRAITGHINSKSTVIDIGSHVGYFTLKAALKASQVFAYEPEKDNYAQIKKNLSLNNIHNVRAFPYAVSNSKEKIMLYLSQNGSGNSIFANTLSKTRYWVKCITLKDIIDTHQLSSIDLLKLDCEGAEYNILTALPDTYYQKIKNIIMEYHLWPTVGYGYEQLTRQLSKHGFRVKRIKKLNKYLGIIEASR